MMVADGIRESGACWSCGGYGTWTEMVEVAGAVEIDNGSGGARRICWCGAMAQKL